MRIGVDLRICQDDRVDLAIRKAMLTFAQAVANNCKSHDMRILLSDRNPHTIPGLRRAFAALHASGRIAVMAEASTMDGHRAASVAAILWETFIRDLECDCVLGTTNEIGEGTRAVTVIDLRESTAVTQVVSNAVADDPAGAATRAMTVISTLISASAPKRDTHTRCDDTAGSRRRLAFVSPLPPEKTGVAAYNANLLPALAKIYDIEVVTDQQSFELPASSVPIGVRSIAEFVERFDSFDRVLYHMGNSPYHAHVPALVREYPGTVVMHDVFLGDLMNWLDVNGRPPGILQRSLLEGNGYAAATALARRVPRGELARRFECNCAMLDEANGIIVHSAFADMVVRARFARYVEPPVARATLCRPVAAGADRGAARTRLGIGEDEFVVSSFGFVNHVKLHRELVAAWVQSSVATSPRARLLIVGQGQGDAYHLALQTQIAASGRASRIAITGYVDDATMADYLVATDAAIQLRSETRGETSGAVLDCLAFGLPLITNGCGALAEIPERAAIRLPVNFSIGELTAAIDSIGGDRSLRERLSREAVDVVATQHNPHDVAQRYSRAIERFAIDGPRARYAHTISALARVMADDTTLDDRKIDDVARAVASNMRRPGASQLLVDITPLVDEDLKTGIERVVRAVMQHLIEFTPAGMRVEPVRFANGKFVYARRFMSQWIGLAHAEEDIEVEPRSGDHFIGLTWSPHAIPLAQQALRQYRNLGVHISFIVYDLLPQRHPNWFPAGLAEQHLGWLVATTAIADRMITISRDVADELLAWLDRSGPDRSMPLAVAHFPLGCDIESSVATSGLPRDAQGLLAMMSVRTTFLMVGTVEPRKGHRQAIEAFSDLWNDGQDVALVIVGKRGWMTADVESLISGHVEFGRRLIRLEGVSDEFLDLLYGASKAVLIPSFGEGFGLPIVEAAKHGIPVVARDLPVFREVAGDGAYYFRGNAPADLAHAMVDWLQLARSGAHPRPAQVRLCDWAQSASLLMDAVAGKSDCSVWLPPNASPEVFPNDYAECAIDFSTVAWPRCLAAVCGLSARESWGRWSDATTSPSVVLEFCKPLPRRARLRITALAFGPNCGSDIRIAVGATQHAVQFAAINSTALIDVETDCSQYAITITPPAPVSPAELGLYNDVRKLGIGLVRLELRAIPVDHVTPGRLAFNAAAK